MKDKNFVCCTDPFAGFMMSFENGLTVSVQWSTGNYCENRNSNGQTMISDMGFVQSNNAEVAVWKTNSLEDIDANQFAPEGVESCDTVLGYLTSEQVVELLNNVKNYNKVEE